jgi:uncharacterized protein (DUF433 family)
LLDADPLLRDNGFMTDQLTIVIDPARRSGKPCIRDTRITVYDVLEYLASGMSHAQILHDFPELTEADIRATLSFAADRERRLMGAASACLRSRGKASASAAQLPTSPLRRGRWIERSEVSSGGGMQSTVAPTRHFSLHPNQRGKPPVLSLFWPPHGGVGSAQIACLKKLHNRRLG